MAPGLVRRLLAIAVSLAVGGVALLGLASAAPAAGSGAGAAPSRLPVVRGSENVSVSIPHVLFGQSDGMPAVLDRGRSYDATLAVWLAAGERPATAVVTAKDGALHDCGPEQLTPGSATRLRCHVTPTGPQVEITVRVGRDHVTFRHVLS